MKFLISQGANINKKAWYGTSLHSATKFNPSIDVLKFLVSMGVDAYAKDSDGKTPLDVAKTAEKKRILEEAMRNPKESITTLGSLEFANGMWMIADTKMEGHVVIPSSFYRCNTCATPVSGRIYEQVVGWSFRWNESKHYAVEWCDPYETQQQAFEEAFKEYGSTSNSESVESWIEYAKRHDLDYKFLISKILPQ